MQAACLNPRGRGNGGYQFIYLLPLQREWQMAPFIDRVGYGCLRGWRDNLFIRLAFEIAASDLLSWYRAVSCSHQISGSELITLGEYNSARLGRQFPMQMNQDPDTV